MTTRKGKATDPADLTPKQRRFVEEYLVDLNGAGAARRAGYSVKSATDQAIQLLATPAVQVAIAEARAAMSERTQITADRVLQELAKIGFADIRQVVHWGNAIEVDGDSTEPVVTSGVVVVNSQELTEQQAAAIAEVSEGPNGIKVKMHDKQAALVSIGRHLGMFKDKLEHSVSEDFAEALIKARARAKGNPQT